MRIYRRDFTTMLAASSAATLLLPRGSGAAQPPATRNVVLVHGLYADGSCWIDVITRLQEHGLNVVSVQNSLSDFHAAISSTQRVLDRMDGPTVLVGHSFGGTFISEAGGHSNVSALVYVAARAPDTGEDFASLAMNYPTPPASAGIVFDGDEGRLSEEAFLRDFAGDLPITRARALFAAQQPFDRALLSAKTTDAAWRSKPSFYAVSTEDRTINPDLQRFMAKRMTAKTIEVKSSHLSMISHSQIIARLILKATETAFAVTN
jgi:pimeloyl-ACP methyl ester carboxylesterase